MAQIPGFNDRSNAGGRGCVRSSARIDLALFIAKTGGRKKNLRFLLRH
jgi:hypothetical protein